MDSFNGQQIPQMNSDSTPRQRQELYMNEQMTGIRGQYSSPSIDGQLRRPNSSINSTNTSIADQMNDLTKQTNSLSFGSNDDNYNSIGGAGDLPNNTLSWIHSEPKGQSSQTSLSSGSMGGNPMASNLSPFAKEFIPRAPMSYSSPPSIPNGANWGKGRTNGPPVPADRDFDDFVALSYLREFIDTITIKPNKYETGIQYLTEVINSYIDEDESVLLTIVNTVVDQAIVDPYFRYNGVRLCIYFMEQLVTLSEEKNFKLLLFKRCQREHSRRETLSKTSCESENYLRGLTMFIGDLYSRCSAPELAEYLPQLLIAVLFKPHKESLKCVCQVLKLCGERLEQQCNERKVDDMNQVMEGLKGSLNSNEISVYMKELVSNVIEMQKRGWTALVPTHPPQVNPYLNMNIPEVIPEPIIPTNTGNYTEEYTTYSDEEEYPADYQTCYDFGQCGDEEDNEVCEAFEAFLKNSGQN